MRAVSVIHTHAIFAKRIEIGSHGEGQLWNFQSTGR